MWEKIFDLAINNGLWAVLFLFLLIYVLKDGSKRETKYQETIKKLGETIEIIKDVQEDVKEIKNKIANKNSKTNTLKFSETKNTINAVSSIDDKTKNN